MKKFVLCLTSLLATITYSMQARDLIVYFFATGNTQIIAEEIARVMSTEILHIEAAEPYAPNPYDDSDRIKEEAYNVLRPQVSNLPTQEDIAQYDRIFVGSPIWWHQPAMVICTFLENYDLSYHVIVPFFTYGAITYLNEAMQKVYKVTPNSQHVPSTLPEDLNADDITTPGRPDDSEIDMPANVEDVENWLQRIGLFPNETSISTLRPSNTTPFAIYKEW